MRNHLLIPYWSLFFGFIQLFCLIYYWNVYFQILSRLFSSLIYFEIITSKYNLLVLKNYTSLIIDGLLVFFYSLNFSLKNLHKTLIKSIIFRLCLLVIVSCLGLLGLSPVYLFLGLSCLVLWSFSVSKQKTLFIINLLFIMIFWSIVYKYISLCTLNFNVEGFGAFGSKTVYTLILFNSYYTEIMDPFDFYSNKNPKEYIEILQSLESWLRDLFKENPNNPDPEFIPLNQDSDDDENIQDIFINLPDKYLEQAVYKEPYGIHTESFDYVSKDLDIKFSKDDLNDSINKINDSLDYSNRYPDRVEWLKKEYEGYNNEHPHIFWGGGVSNVMDMVVIKDSEENIEWFLFNLRNETLIFLQEYNLALGGFYYYNSEDPSKLPSECKKCFDYIQDRNSRFIVNNLDLIIDGQFLIDLDYPQDKVQYIKNYLDDSKTFEEIGDNLLCTGIGTLFWYKIDQFAIECINQNPNITFKDLVLEVQKFKDKFFEDESIRAILKVYYENFFEYDMDTFVVNYKDIPYLNMSIISYNIRVYEDILKYTYSDIIFNIFSKDCLYDPEEDNISPLAFLYGNPHLLTKKDPIANFVYNCMYKFPCNIPLPEQTESEMYSLDGFPSYIPLPEQTESEIKDLYENPADIPLPPITEEEEQFFAEENSNPEEGFSIENQSIGEEFLNESLQGGNFFPDGY